jgi:hypothetical protein
MWQIPSIDIAKKDRFDIFQRVRKEKIRYRNKPGGARSKVLQAFYRDKDPMNGFLRMQRMYKNKNASARMDRRTLAMATPGLLNTFRVRGSIMPGQKKTVYYVDNYDSIKQSAQPGIERIGRMKAGWNQAVIRITGKTVSEVPAWVTKHSGTGGGSNRLKDPFNPSAILRNDLGNVFTLASKFNTVQKAFDLREKNLRAKLQNYLANLVRRKPLKEK